MTPLEASWRTSCSSRLAKLESSPRDMDAERLIADGTKRAPHAVYALQHWSRTRR